MFNEGLIGGFGVATVCLTCGSGAGVRDWRAGPADERDGDRRVDSSRSGRDGGAADKQAQLGRESMGLISGAHLGFEIGN
jgi:hypothetical protein